MLGSQYMIFRLWFSLCSLEKNPELFSVSGLWVWDTENHIPHNETRAATVLSRKLTGAFMLRVQPPRCFHQKKKKKKGITLDTALKWFKTPLLWLLTQTSFFWGILRSTDNPSTGADRFKKELSSSIQQLSQNTLAISTDTLQTACQSQALPYPGIWDESVCVCLQRLLRLTLSLCSFVCLMEGRKVIG